MPKWAEMVVLAVVGLVLTGAVMVYAKFSTQRRVDKSLTAGAPAAGSASSDPHAIEGSPPTAGPSTEDIERAAAKAVTSATLTPPPAPPEREMGPPEAAMVVPKGPAPPRQEEPIETSQTLIGPPLAAAPDPEELAGVKLEDEAGEEKGELDAELEPEEEKTKAVVAKKQEGAKPGSKAELALLQDAQRSLRRLHQLKLRTDVSPAASLEEAARLKRVLNQLDPKTRAHVQAAIDKGYNARNRAPDIVGSLDGSAVKAVRPQDRPVGVDDRPSDVKALHSRITGLRQRLGVKTPSAPSGSGVQPQALPSASPAALPSSGGQGGGLPSVQPTAY